MAKTAAASLVQSRMDYANALFFGTSTHNISQLQRVQHRLAFVILDKLTLNNDQRLVQLHWLPIQQKIDFKIASLTYKTIATSQPSYLHSLINWYLPTRTLRSSSQEKLVVPSLTTNFSRWSFGHASAKIWNSFSFTLRQSTSTAVFSRNLKAHFFSVLPHN